MHSSNFLSRFGIHLPIIQAPMAGGSNTPELVAACCSAGILGSVGVPYTEPDDIERTLNAIRKLTDRPFNVNVFAPGWDTELKVDPQPALEFLRPLYEQLGTHCPEIPKRAMPVFEEQAELLIRERLPIVSFTMGLFPEPIMQRLKAIGTFIIGTATTVNEAVALEQSGVDAIVAQGAEAGGHRGAFASAHPEASVGTMALVPQIVDAVKVPVIASGGIMDGRGIIAALALGASAVQMGTAFLISAESGVSDSYKEAMLRANEDDTVVTNTFSGRYARLLENRYIREMRGTNTQPLPFPWQNAMTVPMRKAASSQKNHDLMAIYTGQGLRMLRPIPAAELVKALEGEMEACITNLRQQFS
jgi:nitronate monooxygenase